ncbi:MAG TPA: Hsp20/alpha crystallin family protein [Candidatus Paceibacterota bacterium]
MNNKKPSFFERLTGSHYYEDEPEIKLDTNLPANKNGKSKAVNVAGEPEDEGEGQLTVDVYQTPDDIIIEAMIPGVKADDLDISITREMVTIRGTRDRYRSVEDDQFFFRELFWGSFSRTILLPQEVEPDAADAREKNGVLTIVLPKSQKDKQHKLRVKSSQS